MELKDTCQCQCKDNQVKEKTRQTETYEVHWVDKISRSLFPIVYTLFVIVYFTYYINNN